MALNALQPTINDGDLTIAKTSGLQVALNALQQSIDATTDLTSNSLTTTELSVNGGEVDLDTSTYFDTIVIRRENGNTTTRFTLDELQVWVNGVNILVENAGVLSSIFCNFSDPDTALPAHFKNGELRRTEKVYNNILDDENGGAMSNTVNGTNALIIIDIPSTAINDIQSLVLYH